MKRLTFLLFLMATLAVNGQNIGLGELNPGFPLNFPPILGDKISLYGNTGAHYGFGIQVSLLQLHTDLKTSNIAFGYGTSAAFNERLRIINSGPDGLVLNGRLTIKNGTIPLDINNGGGVWLYKGDNSALLGFMGTQNNQNIGFYGGPQGWGFTYNALNSRVGIGNNNPNAPLAFGATLEKKITLYPGATGDAGFGMAGNRLQIFSDNPNADVAIGYDASGSFNERFAFKPNGALAVNGNVGAAGSVLSSNGANAATWVNIKPSFYSFKQSDYQLPMPASGNSPGEPASWYVIGGLHNQVITLSQVSTVKLSLKLPVNNPGNAFGGVGNCAVYLGIYDPSNNYIEYEISYLYVPDGIIQDAIAFNVKLNLPAGTYHTHVKVRRFGGDELSTGYYYTGFDKGTLVAEVFPQ